jgi:hypothetical protein
VCRQGRTRQACACWSTASWAATRRCFNTPGPLPSGSAPQRARATICCLLLPPPPHVSVSASVEIPQLDTSCYRNSPASLPGSLPASMPPCLTPASLPPCFPSSLPPSLPRSLPPSLPLSQPACLGRAPSLHEGCTRGLSASPSIGGCPAAGSGRCCGPGSLLRARVAVAGSLAGSACGTAASCDLGSLCSGQSESPCCFTLQVRKGKGGLLRDVGGGHSRGTSR